MSTRPYSSGLRGRLLVSVTVGMAILLGGLTIAFNLVLAHRLDADASGVAQARAAAGLGGLGVRAGHIRLPDAPDEGSPDAQLWVFEGKSVLERPRAADAANEGGALRAAVRAPAGHDVVTTHTRMYALPVAQGGKRIGAVVAGISLKPYEQTQRTALVASIMLALVIFAAVAVAAAWLISKALSPVARMTRQAADWSEHDLERRFSLGAPRDELTQLAGTLNTLLDRVSASLRHEQRLSAEVSHELRTPLASISADAQYALRHAELSAGGRASIERILASARRMAGALDTLMAVARAQLDPRRATSDAAVSARVALEAGAGTCGPRMSLSAPPAAIRVAMEQDLVERILAPLIDNAARYATSKVEVAIAREDSCVTFRVLDDGPGVAGEERDAIFEPGRRSVRTGTRNPAGAGLGLALARRLASSAGGEIAVEPTDEGGRFIVRLPAA